MKEDFKLISKIVERADEMGLLIFDRLSLFMDLENVNKDCGLRLDDFLNADNTNFSHDIIGIQNNFNRQTKEIENCFLPRFAKN